MGTTPPHGTDRQRLGPKNGAPHELIELKDSIQKLVSIQTERHTKDDHWRQADDETHRILIAKVARQSIYIALGGMMVGTGIAWLAAMNAKIDKLEEAQDSAIHALEDKLRREHNLDQVVNDGHHFKRGIMEREIERNTEAIKDLERRVFGRPRKE